MAENRNAYLSDYINKTRVTGYIKSRYQRLFIGYASENELSKSEVVGCIIKEFFERMPENEQKKYLETYDKLSPSQRKRPKNSY